MKERASHLTWNTGRLLEAVANGLADARSLVNLTSIGYARAALPDPSGPDPVVMPEVPSEAVFALIKIEGAGIRYRDDGEDPTPTHGMPLAIGESLTYDATMTGLRVIGQAPGAIVHMCFYRSANDHG